MNAPQETTGLGHRDDLSIQQPLHVTTGCHAVCEEFEGWRGCVSYGQKTIEGSEVLFNILAPGVQEWHLTGGFTHALSKQDELSFAFMHSQQKTITRPNPHYPSQSMDLSMTQFSLQLA